MSIDAKFTPGTLKCRRCGVYCTATMLNDKTGLCVDCEKKENTNESI